MASKAAASALRDLMLGSVAGVINVLTTTPLWVVNTRIKMQGLPTVDTHHQTRYRGLIGRCTLKCITSYNGIRVLVLVSLNSKLFLDGLLKIWRSEGIKALWAGTVPSLLLVINPALQFMTYESLKRRLKLKYGDKELSSLIYFFVGAVAKTVATVLTYPLQIVQAKLRVSESSSQVPSNKLLLYSTKNTAIFLILQHGHKMEGLRKDASLLEIIQAILQRHGLKGLFKGMESKILQTVLTSALMFVVYEKIAAFVFRLMGLKKVI